MTSTVDPSGLLRITADAADQVVVQGNGADVSINGADPSTGPFPLAGIRTIEIVGTASTARTPTSSPFDRSLPSSFPP